MLSLLRPAMLPSSRFLLCHHYTLSLRHLQRRLLCSSSSPHVPLSHPTYMIWSSNTSLGKTLVSTGLASSFLLSYFSPKHHRKLLYLKPVQTGFPSDSDSHFVFSRLCSLASQRSATDPFFSFSAYNSVLQSSPPAANAFPEGHNLNFSERQCNLLRAGSKGSAELVCETLYAWKEAVSPHLAAERENFTVSDSSLVNRLEKHLTTSLEGEFVKEDKPAFCIVETAGGVASPGPSGTLQCDLYRPFRLPGILVGDGRLGGISGTVSAYESLKLRGYDVVAVVFVDHGLANEDSLQSYFRNRVPILVLPSIPSDMSNDLVEWFRDSDKLFDSLRDIMLSAFEERIRRLNDMPKKAGDTLWWPFTQHKLVPEGTVTVIDSRLGENFAVYKIELAREMGYAAGRFGHVMFPENVYEPSLECALLLLEGVGKGWASRVFFSDNGSTAIEIALKMAFRKFCFENGMLFCVESSNTTERSFMLKVLALKGSYHGDTLGAMEAQAPSSYTGFTQQPWYSGRGFFMDPPAVCMCNNKWMVTLPPGMDLNDLHLMETTFNTRDEIFDKSRDRSDLAQAYLTYISKQLLSFSEKESTVHIGALIIEPVIQAAGGMLLIDPLFQRVLVNECRRKNIPVIFDEVFTGFWRLGVETASELLGCVPDIACFAKLMTGGVIPLAATLATEAVFDVFTGDSKLNALLHGHSYSAHAMGCTAAAKAIKWFKDPQTNVNIVSEGLLCEMWDAELVASISRHHSVERVIALGTVCAVELRAEGKNAGYGSTYARELVMKLREDGVYMRPLGNVIYLMSTPLTKPHTCNQLLLTLFSRLQQFHH
ncbi:Bifunctional dethiobiotin synthetase/7,8-diamino-pelargonic acid aminotransferase, mitochondrial [Linum perenne]